MTHTESERAEYLPWSEIVPDPAQPREDIPPDHVERIAASIGQRGLLQYPRVRLDAALGKYVIITGHCRWLACGKAGLDPVPCIVVGRDPSEETILLDQITENEIRQGLTPLSLARALARLKSLKRCNGKQLAAETGLSAASITRSESLLTLPEEVQALVESGEVAESTAYEISRLPDADGQIRLAREVAARKLNRDQAAGKVRKLIAEQNGGTPGDKPERSRLSHRLENGVSVVLSAGRPLTKGDITAAISYLKDAARRLPTKTDPEPSLVPAS